MQHQIPFKVACRVQIWKKTFCQSSEKFGLQFHLKWHYIYVYSLHTKKSIILSLFKIDTLNFTMYISTILTCPLKSYVIGLHNLISMNIFLTIKYRSFSSSTSSPVHLGDEVCFFIVVKRQPKTNKLLK